MGPQLVAAQVLARLGISDFRSQFCHLRFAIEMPQSGLLLQAHRSIRTQMTSAAQSGLNR